MIRAKSTFLNGPGILRYIPTLTIFTRVIATLGSYFLGDFSQAYLAQPTAQAVLLGAATFRGRLLLEDGYYSGKHGIWRGQYSSIHSRFF